MELSQLSTKKCQERVPIARQASTVTVTNQTLFSKGSVIPRLFFFQFRTRAW